MAQNGCACLALPRDLNFLPMRTARRAIEWSPLTGHLGRLSRYKAVSPFAMSPKPISLSAGLPGAALGSRPVSAVGAPLAGVKVLDLVRFLPGPMCTLHMADLGADVIKVEDTILGDYAAAPVRDMVNRNKRGMRLDLKEAAILRAMPLAHWQALFEHAQCCVTPVLRLDEALEHPQFVSRGMSVAVHGSDGQVMRQLACPLRMNGFEFQVVRPAPLPGQHSDEVLREAGWSPKRVADLRAQGVLG